MAATAPRKTTPRKRAPAKAAAPQVDAEASPNGVLTPEDKEWVERHKRLASDPVPAAQAETDIEDIPDGAVAVPLGPNGDIVHILPRRRWRSSALLDLHQGNLEEWAKKCLHRPDYETTWVGLDPDLGEVEEMLKAWQELTGEDVGKASVPRGSLRNGRRK